MQVRAMETLGEIRVYCFLNFHSGLAYGRIISMGYAHFDEGILN